MRRPLPMLLALTALGITGLVVVGVGIHTNGIGSSAHEATSDPPARGTSVRSEPRLNGRARQGGQLSAPSTDAGRVAQEDKESLESALTALLVSLVHSDVEGDLAARPHLIQSNARTARRILRAVALNEEERERVRVRALYLLSRIDETEIQDDQAAVLRSFLTEGSEELRRQAALLISVNATPRDDVVEALMAVATGPSGVNSVMAGRILVGWRRLDVAAYEGILAAALIANRRCSDCAFEAIWSLESSIQAQLDLSEPLCSLLDDRGVSLARLWTSPTDGGWPTEVRIVALVVGSRLGRETRRRLLSRAQAFDVADEEFRTLSEFCLSDSDLDTRQQIETLLRSTSVPVRWATLHGAMRHHEMPIHLMRSVLLQARDPSIVIVRLLKLWVCKLDSEGYQRALGAAPDGDIRALMRQWREEGAP